MNYLTISMYNQILQNPNICICACRDHKHQLSRMAIKSHCIFLMVQYIHIIRGEELYRLARDYTRYLVTGKRTARLKRAMQKWRNFSESFMQKEDSEEDPYGRSAASKPTLWQQPQKFVHLMKELWRGKWRPHAQES